MADVNSFEACICKCDQITTESIEKVNQKGFEYIFILYQQIILIHITVSCIYNLSCSSTDKFSKIKNLKYLNLGEYIYSYNCGWYTIRQKHGKNRLKAKGSYFLGEK